MVLSLSALILFTTNILCYANRHKSTFWDLHMCHLCNNEMKWNTYTCVGLHRSLFRCRYKCSAQEYMCMYNRLASASSGCRVSVVRLVGWFLYICEQCNLIVTFPRLLLKLTNHVYLIHEPRIPILLSHPIDNIQKSIQKILLLFHSNGMGLFRIGPWTDFAVRKHNFRFAMSDQIESVRCMYVCVLVWWAVHTMQISHECECGNAPNQRENSFEPWICLACLLALDARVNILML